MNYIFCLFHTYTINGMEHVLTLDVPIPCIIYKQKEDITTRSKASTSLIYVTQMAQCRGFVPRIFQRIQYQFASNKQCTFNQDPQNYKTLQRFLCIFELDSTSNILHGISRYFSWRLIEEPCQLTKHHGGHLLPGFVFSHENDLEYWQSITKETTTNNIPKLNILK